MPRMPAERAARRLRDTPGAGSLQTTTGRGDDGRAETTVDDHTRTLLTRARDHDRSAIEELFERYRDRLHVAVRRLLGERYRHAVADSEDAVHDAILSALERIPTFDYRGEGSFLAWLLRSAEHQIQNRLRAAGTLKRGGGPVQSLDAAPVPPSPDTTPSNAAAHREDEARVRECIERLPPREREIILLRRYLALEMDEICTELELPSAGAARALLSRAQARLAALLGDRDVS